MNSSRNPVLPLAPCYSRFAATLASAPSYARAIALLCSVSTVDMVLGEALVSALARPAATPVVLCYAVSA